MKNILFIFTLLITFTACGDKKTVTDVLNRAEVLMNEQPDSSLTLLRTLTLDDFRKESNRARYALLHSQALDKNYIDVTDDSLISVAVEYYKDEDDVRSKFLSYYYMGRVHANGKRYLQATSCLMEAEQLSTRVNDDYLLGLLYAELGKIYEVYYDYPKSLEAHQKASECYGRVGKNRHRSYMWLNQSNICRNINDYDESERLLQMALNSSKEEGDSTLMRIVMGSMIMQYIEEHKMLKADSLYQELKFIINEDYGSSTFALRLAQMYLSFGNFAQAEQFIDRGWKRANSQSDSISLYIVSSELYSLQGRGKIAYQELQKGMVMQNKEIYQALQQPVLTAQRDYLSERFDFEMYRRRMEKHLYILYAFFLVMFSVVMIVFLSRRLKKEKEKARQTIDYLKREMQQSDKLSRRKINSLLQELEVRDKSTSDSILYLRCELQKQEKNYYQYMRESDSLLNGLQDNLKQKNIFVTELFKNWFEMMGTLVFLHEEKGVEKNHRMKNVCREIDLMKEKYLLGNRAVRELERMVNNYYDDAMFHFRCEVSLTDELDYRRVCYFFAGFSAQTIGWLMDEKVDNVYQRRLRLRKFVSVSTLSHKDLYLVLLRK